MGFSIEGRRWKAMRVDGAYLDEFYMGKLVEAQDKSSAVKSGRFRLYRNEDSKPERCPMFHVVSLCHLVPTGIRIEDLYIPIEEI